MSLKHLTLSTSSAPSWKCSHEAKGKQTLQLSYSNERQWVELSIEEVAINNKTGKYTTKFTMIELRNEDLERFKTFVKTGM